jgi:predicted alpha/beta-fold hydrolase
VESRDRPALPRPGWLPGGHAQTIWPLLIKGPLPRYRRERWDTPDGDFIDLDWVDGTAGALASCCSTAWKAARAATTRAA